MSKRKGLSLDDKRRVILSIYHNQKEPFNLKEIESLGTKLGVVTQTIKDVNQSLIDDSLVETDKIGAANFFWSFPSKVYQDKIQQRSDLEDSLQSLKDRIVHLNEQVEGESRNRGAVGREQKLKILRDLESEEKSLDEFIEANKYNDPAEILKIEKLIDNMQNHANRWTDNVYQMKKYLMKKAGRSSKECNSILNIDDNFDYPDYDSQKKLKSK